jgi:hypothetical protein
MDKVDTLILDLESRGLGWDICHVGGFVEVRIWKWPNVISRHRPKNLKPLNEMFSEAMFGIDWTQYPILKK